MPVDYRRFNGPEDSVSYKRYTEDYLKSYDVLYKELFDVKGFRKDGRKLDEGRSACMFFGRTDMVTQAKGSSYVELKKTKVICSVFDPREIPHQNEFSQFGQLYCEIKFSPFSCPRRRRPLAPDTDEKALSEILRQALEPAVCRHHFPNYQIDIFIYILEHDGACLAAAINAAGLALADAAVPMYDIITASSIAVIGDRFFIDPTESEEHLAILSPEKDDTNHGIITMSTLREMQQVTSLTQIGSMDVECVTEAMNILEKESEKLVPYVRRVFVENVVQSQEERERSKLASMQRNDLLKTKMEEWKSLMMKD